MPTAAQPPPPLVLPLHVRAAIAELYRQLDDEVRSLGVGCWVRGDCCDFDRTDHILYASSPELEYVRTKHPDPFPGGSRLCPFWVDGKCTEREIRPLGCRTYYCDRRFKDQLEALHEAYYRRLRSLAVSEGIAWSYQPFVAALRPAAEGGAP